MENRDRILNNAIPKFGSKPFVKAYYRSTSIMSSNGRLYLS